MVSGSWPGQAYFWRGRADGGFDELGTLRDANGARVVPGAASALAASDWDADGDVDLLAGTKDGAVWFLANRGAPDGRGRPTFEAPRELVLGGEPLRAAGGNAGPAVADWDGDGTADLLLGDARGGVVVHRASRVDGEPLPRLGPAEVLVEPHVLGAFLHGTRDLDLDGALERRARPCLRTKPTAADWNGDGRLDLIVGDFVVEWSPEPELDDAARAEVAALNERSKALSARSRPIVEALRAEHAARLADHQREHGTPLDPDEADRLYAELEDARAEYAEIRASGRELSTARAAFQKRGARHGWVWVHLRRGNGPASSPLMNPRAPQYRMDSFRQGATTTRIR